MRVAGGGSLVASGGRIVSAPYGSRERVGQTATVDAAYLTASITACSSPRNLASTSL